MAFRAGNRLILFIEQFDEERERPVCLVYVYLKDERQRHYGMPHREVSREDAIPAPAEDVQFARLDSGGIGKHRGRDPHVVQGNT